MLHLQCSCGRTGVHRLPKVLLCAGSRKLFGGQLWQYYLFLLLNPFLFSPLWKEACWQSADSAFIRCQQLGLEEICNHRLWVVHSTCTCGCFTGYYILNNCLSWKLAIIFNYTHTLYSHKHTVKQHRNRNTNLSHLLMFCVNRWIIDINLQELQAPLLVFLFGTRQVILNFFGFPGLQIRMFLPQGCCEE